MATLDAADGTVDGKINLANVSGATHTTSGPKSYEFVGTMNSERVGFSVSSAGDVDADGKADLIIGARGASYNAAYSGAAFLVSGNDLAALDAADGTVDGKISVGSINTTNSPNSYRFIGEQAGDFAGFSVSSAGDVDGDGRADIIIGANDANTGYAADGINPNTVGKTYLIHAKDLAALDAADGKVDGTIYLSNVFKKIPPTLNVTVDDAGSGTSVKTGSKTGTDTITNVQNFVAGEVAGQTDTITLSTTVTDRSTVTGLDDNSTGTFTHGPGTYAAGQTIAFGPAGSGAPYTFSQLMALNMKGTISITSGDEAGKIGNISFSNFETINFNVVCFTAGTMISTIEGDVSAELLRAGDMVETQDNGYQEIRWIGRRKLSRAELEAQPSLIPVRISAGALGAGLPERDLIVSPQHRILVCSRIAERLFDSEEVLVAAKQLVMLDGIDYVDDPDGVEYVHFMCSQHEVVFAEGAPTESMYAGHQALLAVSEAARQEIFAIFPELSEMNPDYRPPSARFLPSGRMGRKLAMRHQRDHRPILQTW